MLYVILYSILYVIPQTSVALGVVAVLVDTEVCVVVPKYVRANWPLCSPVVSRGLRLSPAVSRGFPCSPVLSSALQCSHVASRIVFV